MLFLQSFCLRDLLPYYPGCLYSQNHPLFLKEYLPIPFLLDGCLQLSLMSCAAAACPQLMKLRCLFCLALPRWYEDSPFQ